MPFQVRDTKKSWERILRLYLGPRKQRRRGGHGLPEPIEPDSPKHLTGGAAAALEFDD